MKWEGVLVTELPGDSLNKSRWVIADGGGRLVGTRTTSETNFFSDYQASIKPAMFTTQTQAEDGLLALRQTDLSQNRLAIGGVIFGPASPMVWQKVGRLASMSSMQGA